MVDRQQLADFLRLRRAVLQPEDVGMPRSARRRTTGLRREEVASLAAMSTDYYTRLEQQRGPQPSPSILTSLARALRLTQDERDHLFVLAGHVPVPRSRRSDYVSPALMRVLDRLDTPALVVTDLGVTLAQNPMAVALLGDQTGYTGFDRFLVYRWFTRPQERNLYLEADRDHHEAQFVSQLRGALARNPDDEQVQNVVGRLLAESPEFTAAWARHAVSIKGSERKRIVSPTVGLLEVDCQSLSAEDDGQFLLVFTATPGSSDHEKMRLLSVVGDQRFAEPDLLATPAEPE